MQIAVNMSQFKVNIGFGSGQAFSFCTNNKTEIFVTKLCNITAYYYY